MNLMEKYKKKMTAIQTVSWPVLSEIHLQAARSLSAEGFNLRLSTPVITQAEDALNNTWLACLRGKASIEDTKAINEQWAEALRLANKRNQKTTLF